MDVRRVNWTEVELNQEQVMFRLFQTFYSLISWTESPHPTPSYWRHCAKGHQTINGGWRICNGRSQNDKSFTSRRKWATVGHEACSCELSSQAVEDAGEGRSAGCLNARDFWWQQTTRIIAAGDCEQWKSKFSFSFVEPELWKEQVKVIVIWLLLNNARQ